MGETNDIGSVIMDEIALEGLDGITIEGLFVRLKERPEFSTSLNDAYKHYIWDIICNFSEIDMLELPEPRGPLVIFNRYDYVDPELGMVQEPETLPEELYPHSPIDDKKKGIRGSCALYTERVSVYITASQLNLQEVTERWGTRLVIAASQKMRNIALMGSSVDPELELTILQYCILERVGRSRHLGEVTQGRVSLQITGEDPKALFYHRKYLMKHGLIVKQIHHQKSGSQNCSGSLLHLPRFYVERWPKVLFLTKRVVEILRSCKNYVADYEEIRKKLGLTNSLKKLFQTSYFQRFVRTDLRLPYRHLYPDAKETEWRSQNSMKEKMIRVIQLLDPNADVDVMSTRDDEFDIDDEEHSEATSSREEFSITLNRSFLSQVYQVVEGAGVNGYSQMQLVEKMGLSKLSARTASRNLLKRGVASKFMNDVGRQRVSRFRARKWDQQCTRIQTIERDIQHMRAELLSKALGAGHEIAGAVASDHISIGAQDNQRGMKRPANVSVEDLKLETEATQAVKRSSDSPTSGPPPKVQRMIDATSVESSSAEIEEQDNHSVVSPVSAYPSTPLYCSVANFNSKEGMRQSMQHQTRDGPVMTYRIFKRINMILEYVKIHKVVDDHSKFLKLINEEEEREGLNMKIDKKSLLRLLIRLKEDGRLKLHSYLLTDGVKVKTMIFICDHNVALDHPAIISAIEQAKMKLFIVNRDSINLAVAYPTSKGMQSQKAQNKKQKMTFLYDKTVGRKYGFCPKFIRMRTLHQFLFYLVYGYEGDPNLDQNMVVPFLESKDVMVDDSLRSELTQVYVFDVHWKMFIPPLPAYSGGPKGWSIMCDLLLRLPLSIFVRIFNVCYVVAGLNEYLQHPVRRHFLVRQLPVPMRNGLMAFRKYIFSIHEVLQRLCYIGLIQFGPQRLKEKDQVLIYLNRRTSLLDTITSKPGYHQISVEDYPEIKYEYRTMQDIETYWYNLWNICINTQLGGRMCVQGTDIVLEHLAFKASMQEALQPVRPSRAPVRDTGVVPGDQRGAAGLDSAIFAHLKRNWNWANISTKSGDLLPKRVDRRKFRIMNLKAAPVVFTKSAIIVKRSINYLQKGRFNAVRTERRSSQTIPPAGAEVLPKKGQKGKQNVVRRIEARKTRVTHRPFYDDVDLKALQLMSKLRVEWSTEEDTLLLLCKVASMYLCPNPRQQTIALSSIRDILHSCLPEAQNKTSRACQRRVLYMMKNLATSNNLAMHLEELKQDEEICERFGKPEDNARSSLERAEEFEARIHEKFRILVNELQSRSDRMVTATTGTYCSTIPDTADDFWKLFDVVEPRTVIKSKGAFQDVKNIVDIHCSVVNTIIHSSLCSTTDKTSWAYQLFRVYQQYPDSLLRAAMAKLRQDQMVSLKKSYARYKQKGNYLPLSSSPYQLSVSYLQLIQTKYQYGVFHEAYEMIKEVLARLERTNVKQGMPVTGASGGGAASMVELLCKKGVSLSVDIPEQVIILDPWICEKDETYTRIVQRYKDILQTYRTGRDSTTSALFRLSLGNMKEFTEAPENMSEIHCPEDTHCPDKMQTSFDEKLKQAAVDNDVDDDYYSNLKNDKLQLSEKICDVEMENTSQDSQNDLSDRTNKDFSMPSKILVTHMDASDYLEHQSEQKNETSKLTENSLEVETVAVTPLMPSVLNSNVQETEIVHVQETSSLHCGVSSTSTEELRSCGEARDFSSKEIHVSENEKDHFTQNSAIPSTIPKSAPFKKVVESHNHTSDVPLKKPVTEHQPKSDVLKCINDENNVISNSLKAESLHEISLKSTEAENCIEKKSAGEMDNTSRLDKTLNRKWGRLDFEWTPDREWDFDSDISERAVEEPDEADGTDEDRIRGDYISMEGEPEDTDGGTPNNQQTLVARAATRIALFMMKEEMDDSSQVNNKQHAHDFFVVNSCSVFCHLYKEEANTSRSCQIHVSPREKLLPLKQDQIEKVLNEFKSGAIIDLQQPVGEEVLKSLPPDYWPSLEAVMSYVESKKYLGATLSQIQSFYENEEMENVSLATVISLLVEHRVLMRAGVTVPRYVHRRHMWPWLAHTFKFVRLEREKVTPSGSRIVSFTEETEDNNIMDVEKQEVGTDKTLTPMEEVSDVMMEEQVTQEQLGSNNLSSQSSDSENHVVDMQTPDIGTANINNKDQSSCEKENTIYMTKMHRNTSEENIDTPCDNSETKQVNCLENVEETEVNSTGKKSPSRKPKQLAASHPLGTIGSKDMRRVAQDMAVSEKDEIHVVIRPWIRINGSLNRRVLDRLLGAILGHAMYQPGQSLHSFGRRFQPGLQPVHTRELIEVLQKLGCVKLLVRQQKQKVTLFSKPKPVILVDADGTEDEQEIIVEPEADAICRLGQFIGEKSYNQDFMAAQEQMFTGRGSSEETSKKKKSVPENVTNSTNEPLGSYCGKKENLRDASSK